jgi:hypothetical protein
MEKCAQILRFIREKDVELGAFFSEPVDPGAWNTDILPVKAAHENAQNITVLLLCHGIYGPINTQI